MRLKDQVSESGPDTRSAAVAPPQPGPRPSAERPSAERPSAEWLSAEWLSAWMPPRRALVPIALPRRFVDGVAWDEV